MEVFESSDILDQNNPLFAEFQEPPKVKIEKRTKRKLKSRKKLLSSTKKYKTEKISTKNENFLMKSVKKEVNTNSEMQECRFCLITIDPERKKTYTKLTESIENSFYEITQRNLQNCDYLSKFLCSKCEKDIKNAVEYRQKLISIQNELESRQNEEFAENIVVKCEIKDEIYNNVEENFELFDSTQILDQFEEKVVIDSSSEEKIEESKPLEPKSKTDMRVICPDCGVLYSNKQSLKKHIAYMHLRIKKFFCDLCGYASAAKHSLKSHMKTHSNREDREIYKCDKCPYFCMTSTSLKSHHEGEHEGIMHECMCGKKFKKKTLLQFHIKYFHEKKKDYVCECGKSFFNKGDLEDHIKIKHTYKPSRDFHCEQCGKSFITKKQLARHLEFHKEALFPCPHCEKSYRTQFKLKRHMKHHEGSRDLLCHLCEAAYFFNRDLQRHLDVVHKQIIYFCEFCEFTNSRKDYLGNHLKSAHSMMNSKDRKEVIARAKFIKNNV